jgi:hypothetical protein
MNRDRPGGIVDISDSIHRWYRRPVFFGNLVEATLSITSDYVLSRTGGPCVVAGIFCERCSAHALADLQRYDWPSEFNLITAELIYTKIVAILEAENFVFTESGWLCPACNEEVK